jgi:Phage integrase central domain/Arm DNA-binding domain
VDLPLFLQREIARNGLGSLKAVGLAAARLKAATCKGLLADGIDPIAARSAEHAQRAVEDARAITFDHCADAFIKAHASGWKNQKHIAQWRATLKTYVSPVFESLPVQAVDVSVELCSQVIEPTRDYVNEFRVPPHLPTNISEPECALRNFRFTPNSGHVRCKEGCPLSANSGH